MKLCVLRTNWSFCLKDTGTWYDMNAWYRWPTPKSRWRVLFKWEIRVPGASLSEAMCECVYASKWWEKRKSLGNNGKKERHVRIFRDEPLVLCFQLDVSFFCSILYQDRWATIANTNACCPVVDKKKQIFLALGLVAISFEKKHIRWPDSPSDMCEAEQINIVNTFYFHYAGYLYYVIP